MNSGKNCQRKVITIIGLVVLGILVLNLPSISADGKLVNIDSFKLEKHLSSGYINIVCKTDALTTSLEPWINRNEPFPYSRFETDLSRTHMNADGTMTAVFKFFVDEDDLSGSYHIGCWLDNMRDDTDLVKTIPYPAVGSIIRTFNFDKEEDDNDNHRITRIKNLAGCEPLWQCSGWSECTDGVQTRNCEDQNFCDFQYNKPNELQGCSSDVISLAKTEPAKVEGEFNWIFWLSIGIGIILLLIIVVLIVR